jgi:multiple sugar transport system substrate-binding protein
MRVALVHGPMYDHLYRLSPLFDATNVEVVIHADHPTLNKAVADMLGAGERLDLIATHSKYAPSQSQWLEPLDSLCDPGSVSALAPLAVDLCRYDGHLLSVPRLIDVRILWARSDRIGMVPTTWQELVDSDVVFGFPGRESGLFGTFFELVVGMGGRLFDDDDQPCFDSPEAVASIELLCRLASRAPLELPTWHYDEVDRALLSGQVDAAAAWPGGWGSISKSALAGVLMPHPYPAGPTRRVSYAGCHAWAIPTTCGDVPGALQLLTELVGFEAQSLDATGGTICAHTGALDAVEPINDVDSRRLAITQATIAEAMITYPPLERFPAIEEAGWTTINAALRGDLPPGEAARLMQGHAVAIF